MRKFRETRPGTLDHYDASARIAIDNRSRLAWGRYGLAWEDSLNRNSRGEVEASVAGVLRGSRPIPGILGGVRNDAPFPPRGNSPQDSEKRAGPQKFDGVGDRSQNSRDARASDTVGRLQLPAWPTILMRRGRYRKRNGSRRGNQRRNGLRALRKSRDKWAGSKRSFPSVWAPSLFQFFSAGYECGDRLICAGR